jgi:hypothetical protein
VAAVLAFGIYLSWPLYVALFDLVTGSQHASEVIQQRDRARMDQRHDDARLFLWLSRLIAAAAGLSSLIWGPGIARRHRRSLVVSMPCAAIGLLVLIPWLAAGADHILRTALSSESFVVSLREVLGLNIGWIGYVLWGEALCFAAMVVEDMSGLPMGVLGSIVGTGVLMLAIFTLNSDLAWWWKGLLLVGASLLGVCARGINAYETANAQRVRNEAAVALYNAVLAAPEAAPRYALFLRPFSTTNVLAAQGSSEGDVSEHLDLETILSEALTPKRFLALSTSGVESVLGAGKLFLPDDGWLGAFHTLASNAALILMIPSAHGATLEEVKSIVEKGWLEKTLFIMPEFTSASGWRAVAIAPNIVRSGRAAVDFADYWRITAAALDSECGLRLPDYQPSGAVLRYSDPQHLVASSVLGLGRTLRKVARARRAIHRSAQAASGPPHAP